MNEVELQRLVVRITGDSQQYVRSLQQAQQSTQQTATAVQNAAGRIEGITNSLRGFASTAVSALGALGLAASLSGAFKSFADMERSVISLKAAIEAGGHSVDDTMKKYDQFTDSIVNQTLMTRGAVRQLLVMAETQGFSGDQAEQLVRTATALGKGNGDLAQSYFNVAVMLQRGHPEFAKRILGLRDVKDKTELLQKIQERLNSLQKQSIEIADSASGKMEKFGRALAGLSIDIGAMVADVILPLVDWLTKVAQAFAKLDPATKRTVALVLGAVLAFELLGPVLRTAAALLGVLQVQQVLGLIGWVTWTAAVWAANAALTAFNLLMSLDIAVSIPLVAALAIAFVTAGAAAYALYQSGRAVIDVFRNLPLASPGLAAIGGMLREWWGVIKDVVKAATVDLPLAWKIASAGFSLALSEMRDQFPPFLQFVQKAFSLTWQLIATDFKVQFNLALTEILTKVANAIDVFGLRTDEFNKKLEGTRKAAEQDMHAMGVLAASALKAAFEDFKPGEESAATHLARGWLKALQGQLQKTLAEADKKQPGDNKWKDIGNQAAAARKEIEKFDIALSGSAEAISRIQAQQDRFRFGKGEGKAFDAAAAGGAEAGTREDANTDILRQIRDTLVKQDKKPGLNVQEAGLA